MQFSCKFHTFIDLILYKIYNINGSTEADEVTSCLGIVRSFLISTIVDTETPPLTGGVFLSLPPIYVSALDRGEKIIYNYGIAFQKRCCLFVEAVYR